MKEENSSKIINYRYKFFVEGKMEMTFDVKLDKKTLNLIQPEKKSYPSWTLLDNNKCPNCTLDSVKTKYCPIAVSLVDIVDFFKSSFSYEKAEVIVETKERIYTKHTTVQKGVSSLMGIYMVTSGCPVMEKLKPMVRYHLPFTTTEETKFRIISMYLLGQYLLFRKNQKPDWELKNLVKLYDDIRVVNRSFCKRLSEIEFKDANRNALITLNCFAESITFSINENLLQDIELLYSAYFTT